MIALIVSQFMPYVLFFQIIRPYFFFPYGAAAQRGPWPPHWGFLITPQRRITVGRTPLDKWSARRTDLYLTTQNTHNRQTSMPPAGFEPTISAGERPQIYALDRAATGTSIKYSYLSKIISRECTQLWVLCRCHCNGRSDFKETNLSLRLSFWYFLSLQHLLHSCQRRHVRRAKRTVDFCVDNKKGPFGNRLLVKLRLGKENKGGREDATFQNLKESVFFLSWRHRQTGNFSSYNPQLSETFFHTERDFFLLHLYPKLNPFLCNSSKQPLAMISF